MKKINLKSKSVKKQKGFTLVELMVVIVIIGVLASLGAPLFNNFLLTARAKDALPYLMQIASKERMYKIREGNYYIAATSGSQDEQLLESNLGVDLRDSADFCYVVVCEANCETATAAGNMAGTAYLTDAAPTTPTPEFEVWAILRTNDGTNGANDTVTSTGSFSCVTADVKNDATGWVDTLASATAGSESRMIILRYPPPADGISGAYDWSAGITISDVIR